MEVVEHLTTQWSKCCQIYSNSFIIKTNGRGDRSNTCLGQLIGIAGAADEHRCTVAAHIMMKQRNMELSGTLCPSSEIE